MLNTEVIRKQFPFLQQVLEIRAESSIKEERAFLDNTASTQLPLPVLEHIAKSLFTYANIHRGEYDASQITTEEFERAYNVTANLVNAEHWQEIVLGRNTTEMINLAMRTMSDDFRDGDNIVATRLEHNSNYVPWYGLQQLLARRGIDIEIKLVDFNKETGELDMQQLERLVDNKTKLVTATGASNFMGIKPDIKTIGKIAHASGYSQPRPDGFSGSYFLVDAAQLVPGTPVDVQEIDCDFLAWSFHKMALPLGVGGLYAKKAILESLDPFLYGGDMIEDVQEGLVEYKEIPWKFTAGTPNILGTIGTGYGIMHMMNIGLGNIFNILDVSKDEEVRLTGEQIKTEVLMNTPRGELNIPYNVAPHLADTWRAYLGQNPGLVASLREPKARLALSRDVVKRAMTNIMQHEEELTQKMLYALAEIPGVKIYGTMDATKRSGLAAFEIDGIESQSVAFQLNQNGIEARNGNHCASLAHQYVGIEGSVRLSFYVYNNQADVAKAAIAVEEISKTVRG